MGARSGTGSAPPARSRISPAAARSGAARSRRYHSIQVALSALDRLEVRGRDSAGLHVLVAGHGLDLADADVARLIAERGVRSAVRRRARCASPTGTSRSSTRPRPRSVSSATTPRACARRSATTSCCASRCAPNRREAAVLAHTRWASVGIISEPNAHPLNQEELDGDGDAAVRRSPRSTATSTTTPTSRRSSRCASRAEITTDAKVIPALVVAPDRRGRRARRGVPLDGRVVRGLGRDRRRSRPPTPDRVLLALRGSGQALYVGLGDDCVRRRERAVRRRRGVRPLPAPRRRDDARAREPGERRARSSCSTARRAGPLAGIARLSYDGRALPVAEAELQTPRDHDARRRPRRRAALPAQGDRRGARRRSARRCAASIVERDGRLDVRLPAETLRPRRARAAARGRDPARARDRAGHARTIAGQSLAHACCASALGARPVHGRGAAPRPSCRASGSRADMSDTLVVAISQSGTTTDTNRTVDLARARGARR